MATIKKPEMPLLRETPDQIYQRMVNRMNAMAAARGETAPATGEAEYFYDLEYPIAEEFSEQQQIDEYKFLQWFLPWADGEYLDGWGVLLGLPRTEKETDAQYRPRLEAKASEEEGNGAEYDYRRWIKEVPGVGEIFIWGESPNKVHIALTGEDGLPAISELVTVVQNHLNQPNKHHMNDNVIVMAAVAVNLTISGLITELETNTSIEQVAPLIEAEIRSYIKEQRSKILYSEIYNRFKVPGVIDYGNVLVNESQNNVAIPFAHIPIVQNVTVTKV